MANIIGLRCRFGSKRGWLLWGFSIPSLSVGWIMILASVILSLVFHPSGLLTVDTLIKSLPVLVGIMIGLLAIISLTALSENFEPPSRLPRAWMMMRGMRCCLF